MTSKIKNSKIKMNEQVVIIGGGGHARVLVDILRLCSCRIIGYTDKEKQRNIDIDYLGNDDVLASTKYLPSKVKLVNGVGSVRLPVGRQKIFEKFKTLGYRFSSVIYPRAIILPSAKLAEGAQVMAGAVIGTGATIGENVIINTSSSIDHDCVIGAHTHVAPGVTVSGGVTIGKACHIGTGAKIIQGVLIGDNVFVLAGAVVVENVKSDEIGRSIYHRAISEDRDLK